jgi:hypothetical protein
MRRREFVALLGGTATAWPFAVRAQQAPRVIGLLGSDTAEAQSRWTTAFVQRLRELGWTEGSNVVIKYRWAEGRSDRFAEIASEFVRDNVSVILTHNTPPTLAAKRATSTIPIVFATAGDPIETGIVASLARPGGNITGLSSQAPDSAGKKLELMREIVPGLHRLATLAEIGNPYAALDVGKIRDAARLSVRVRWYLGGLGNATAAAQPWPACHKHPQHVVTALARLAEAWEPLPCAVQQLRRICARTEPGHQEKGCRLVRAQRRSSACGLCRDLDDVQRRSRHKVQTDTGSAPGPTVSSPRRRMQSSSRFTQRRCRSS